MQVLLGQRGSGSPAIARQRDCMLEALFFGRLEQSWVKTFWAVERGFSLMTMETGKRAGFGRELQRFWLWTSGEGTAIGGTAFERFYETRVILM